MARPPHIFIDNSIYFITCRTKKGIRFFNSNKKKELILEAVNKSIKKYNYKIFSWVILDNHYHLLLFVPISQTIPNFIRYINSRSAVLYYKTECRSFDCDTGSAADKAAASGKFKIWQNYWDKCIDKEANFWTHFNYIHHNPIKHQYSNSMANYYFSSYNYYLKTKGQEWLDSIFEAYPIINFHV